MFGRRKQQTDEAPTNDDTSTVGSFSPVSRFAPAEGIVCYSFIVHVLMTT
jgi:hypothetical protein